MLRPPACRDHTTCAAPRLPAPPTGALAGPAGLCSIAGLGLYARGLKRRPPSTAVNLLNLVPVFGLVIPLVALGEHVTVVQIIGGLVVIAGVTLSTRTDSSTRHMKERGSVNPL